MVGQSLTPRCCISTAHRCSALLRAALGLNRDVGTRARARAPCSAVRGDSTAPPQPGTAASRQARRPLHCTLPPSAVTQLHQTLLEGKHFHFSPCKKEGAGACSTAPDTGRHFPVASTQLLLSSHSAPGAPAGSRAKVRASPANKRGDGGAGRWTTRFRSHHRCTSNPAAVPHSLCQADSPCSMGQRPPCAPQRRISPRSDSIPEQTEREPRCLNEKGIQPLFP